MEVGFAILSFGIFKMDGALVKAHGRTRLHSCGTNAPPCDGLCEVCNGRLSTSAAGNFVAADMHQAIEKGAGSNDHALSPDLYAPYRTHADGFPVLYEQLVSLVLPDVEIGGAVKSRPPPPDKLSSVALRAR